MTVIMAIRLRVRLDQMGKQGNENKQGKELKQWWKGKRCTSSLVSGGQCGGRSGLEDVK